MKRGFTLIEALVVFAIVMIIAALLFPLFARPRETCCGPSCQSNLKQIGLSFIQYTQDNDDRFSPLAINTIPAENSTNSEFRKPYGWADALQTYIRVTQVYQCPNETQTEPNKDGHKAATPIIG